MGISTNAPTPEVGQVKYLSVLDEIADNKDTVLHVISDLYTKHMVAHNHKFLVLEGDAKVWDIMQLIKREYGSDLDWLIPMPGDWHLLKNYQLCLMKLHMWQQAESNNVVLAPLSSNGWARDEDGSLVICWDTEESRRKVKERVMLLLKGCGCKSGCKSGRCGCIKRRVACGRCINCTNTESIPKDTAPIV